MDGVFGTHRFEFRALWRRAWAMLVLPGPPAGAGTVAANGKWRPRRRAPPPGGGRRPAPRGAGRRQTGRRVGDAWQKAVVHT
jgi:hypothetical protein